VVDPRRNGGTLQAGTVPLARGSPSFSASMPRQLTAQNNVVLPGFCSRETEQRLNRANDSREKLLL
jgi:hypothetical protein